jgi:rare lipoprotein A
MNRQIVLLTFVTVILAACTVSPIQHGKPAPVFDLGSGPGGVPPQPRTPKVETNAVAPVPPPEQTKGAYLVGDGPGVDEPANLDDTPDAVPKAEPLHKYANRPYTALGKTYTPLETLGTYKEVGIASWYGRKFHGLRTSIGDVYDMYGMTASHPTLPIPSYARITNVLTKKSVIVRVNDRGPFMHDRIIDLSYTAAHKLGIINNGTGEVEVESLAVEPSTPALLPPLVTSVPIPPVVEVAKVLVAAPVQVSETAMNASPANLYLQLGAFKSAKVAKIFLAKMHKKLGSAGNTLNIIQKNKLSQVVLGPYATQKEAIVEGKKIKAKLGLKHNVSVRKLK